MEHLAKGLGLLLALLLVLEGSTICLAPVEASSRTLVVPDDYPTIDSALKYAADGDTVFVRNGTYDGPINQTLTVEKSITIMGESREGTIIRLFAGYNETWIFATCLPTYTDALVLEADNCRLLNLTLVPRGYLSIVGDNTQVIGTNISSPLGLSVTGSNCKIIDNLHSGCIWLNGTHGYIARNSGVSLSIGGSQNLVRNNTSQFISLVNATNNIVASNKLSSELGHSAIDLVHSNNNVLLRNTIEWCTFGFRLWFSSDNLIAANTIARCHHSVAVGNSSNNRIYLNNFIDNEPWSDYLYDQYADPAFRDAYLGFAASENYLDNGEVGNFWENCTGADADGNGVFDSPYLLVGVFRVRGEEDSMLMLGQDNYPLTSRVDIEEVNVELPAWARALLELPESTILQPASASPAPTQSTNPASTSGQEPQSNLQPQEQTEFPLTLLIVVAVGATAIALAFLVYRRKSFQSSTV